MAYEFYVKIKAKTQGDLKGESSREKWTKHLGGIGFHHEIKSPRDVATGQASGKRQHGPISFWKEWGSSSPQLMQALATNEVLPEVTFEFVKTSPEGAEEVYYKITLTDATISGIQYVTGTGESAGSAKTTTSYDTHELERVSFSYRAVQHETMKLAPGGGGTMAKDDWIK